MMFFLNLNFLSLSHRVLRCVSLLHMHLMSTEVTMHRYRMVCIHNLFLSNLLPQGFTLTPKEVENQKKKNIQPLNAKGKNYRELLIRNNASYKKVAYYLYDSEIINNRQLRIFILNEYLFKNEVELEVWFMHTGVEIIHHHWMCTTRNIKGCISGTRKRTKI